jgi:hypothetical protein
MKVDDTLDQIVALNDIIEKDTRVMKTYEESFTEIKEDLQVLKTRQQQLIFDVAKWAICEGWQALTTICRSLSQARSSLRCVTFWTATTIGSQNTTELGIKHSWKPTTRTGCQHGYL